MLNTTSQEAATARGVSCHTSPRPISGCALARVRLVACTRWPASSSRPAMRPPIVPSPTTPTVPGVVLAIVPMPAVMFMPAPCSLSCSCPVACWVSCSSVAALDLGEVLGGEVEVRGRKERVDLIRSAEADDRRVDGRVTQGPCLQGPPDHLLRAAEPVGSRGVDPVHPQLQRPV